MTELCKGTLDCIVRNSALSKTNRINILYQIASGLAHLHSHNIVHRDLKPQNILYSFTHDRRLVMKLADFGCSRTLPVGGSHYSRSKTKEGHSYALRPFGTDGWLAPEVLNGSLQCTFASDIFPLGLVFVFTLCNGFHPFGDDPTTRNGRIRTGLDEEMGHGYGPGFRPQTWIVEPFSQDRARLPSTFKLNIAPEWCPGCRRPERLRSNHSDIAVTSKLTQENPKASHQASPPRC